MFSSPELASMRMFKTVFSIMPSIRLLNSGSLWGGSRILVNRIIKCMWRGRELNAGICQSGWDKLRYGIYMRCVTVYLRDRFNNGYY